MASPAQYRPLLRLSFQKHPLRLLSTHPSRHLPDSQTPIATPPPPSQPSNPNASLRSLMSNFEPLVPRIPQPNNPSKRRSAFDAASTSYRAADLERNIHRRFRPGDIYAPHDLSSTEQQKWRARNNNSINAARSAGAATPDRDVFDHLAINPLNEYKNFSMMTEYVTSMGRIRHRRETGLRGVNQRRVARAVRRAVGMGLMPSVHKHPEMLEREALELGRRRGMMLGGGKRGGGMALLGRRTGGGVR
ncbi:MAG: hypothetical protein Q9220_004622 [cf. Caloplaca sp. 1 TL-2023]